MATYKKGYKKETSGQVLLKVIVGIIVAVLLIVAFAFIYDQLTVTRSYDDFTKIDTYETILSQEDTDGVLVPEYLVYFYSDTCTNCESIKADALKLAEKLEKEGIVIYFVDIANTTDDDTFKDQFLLDIDESSLKTPMVISVINGTYEDKFIGTDDVISVLTDVLNGDYAPFN
ncbi:MAG: hypothetical protein AB7U79_02515 [Candidatus Izemoplasmatales bacterium]